MTKVAGSQGGLAAEQVRPPLSTRAAATWSIAAHVVLIGSTIVLTRLAAPAPMPPAYAVELVAAPAGPRALGAVQQGPTAPSSAAAAAEAEDAPARPPDPVAAAGTNLSRRPAAAAKRPVSTPSATAAKKPVAPTAAASTRKPSTPAPAPARPAAPKSGGEATVPGTRPAGGGPTGGRGRDVASVKVQGIAFPYPGYLENITRQIALNFKPRPGVALKAEVTFLIHRDGSISDLRLVSRSGAYAFDLECIGAVEAVGQRKSFGTLPAGFRDDVLPVVFSFDPTVLR